MGAYVLYAAVYGSAIRLGVSGSPGASFTSLRSVDAGLAQFVVLSRPLPLWLAEQARQELERVNWGSQATWGLPFRLWALRYMARRTLSRSGERGGWYPLTDTDASVQLGTTAEVGSIRQLLAGRILLEDEVQRLLDEEAEGVGGADAPDLLEQLLLRGDVIRHPAVNRDAAGRWRCLRCGSRDQVDVGSCVRCGREGCAACTECSSFGTARACEAIIAVPWGNSGQERQTRAAIHLKLAFELSDAQQRAAQALLNSHSERSLVWAACGAGKTEVVYQLIEQSLQRGDPVLFAVPRRDIVQELGDRLQQAFPKARAKSLYGGSARKFSDADLVIATTHQVMRFYQRFPLIVLDEVDAFPYRGNAMLRRGVERALLPGGRLVFMTATPTESLLQTVQRKKWDLITIPARHHRHPLPVPDFTLVPQLARTRTDMERDITGLDAPKDLAECVQQLIRSGRPLLVFVPTVRLVAPTARVLDHICRSGGQPAADALPLAYGTHARDPRRDGVRKAFDQGQFPVLVATTVLERGITIPGVNVIVLWADYERVFDSATLIQMAGRAGRTTEHPTGQVYFFAQRETKAMVQARQRIQDLNREAHDAGYLVHQAR